MSRTDEVHELAVLERAVLPVVQLFVNLAQQPVTLGVRRVEQDAPLGLSDCNRVRVPGPVEAALVSEAAATSC